MPKQKPDNWKFNVTLSGAYYDKLRLWADAEGDYVASKSASILERAIDEAEAQGKIPTEDQPDIEGFNCLIGYIELLSGTRKAKDFDFKYLAEITGFTETQLRELYTKLLEGRGNA